MTRIAKIIGICILALGTLNGFTHSHSSIGGDRIPHGLRCMEDEIIAYENGNLACVHSDAYFERELQSRAENDMRMHP